MAPHHRPRTALTGHAWERIADRLHPDERTLAVRRAEEWLQWQPRGRAAVRLLQLTRQRNEPWSDVSNGDEVWAILDGCVVITVMLRRSTQPKTAESLRVDRVVLL